MKINLSLRDTIVRLLLGTISIAWAVAGGPWWAYFGLYFLMSGSWRFCPVYAFFQFSTCRET